MARDVAGVPLTYSVTNCVGTAVVPYDVFTVVEQM
jgi:hypothetical protein